MSKLDERLAGRNYTDPNERKAFRLGYENGYAGRPRESRSWLVTLYPNAYSAGYWEGYGDKHEIKD
jgi:hypothetical protein